ncbi:MAG: LON peptidase substrate-binding domain-containing protein [Ktedonobacterales bacterium]
MADERFEVALFPLDVVLFPGMALPLHIFEPRYQRMMADCLADRAPFGVVLTEPETEHDHVREVPARVGTLARIADYEKLDDGRFNLLAQGTRRFEVIELRTEKPYATALVKPFLDDEAAAPGPSLVAEAREALATYLHTVMALIGSGDQAVAIPDDAHELSYLVGMCLTCEDCEKQALLEMRSLAQRLREGARMLHKETALLAKQLAQGTPDLAGDRSILN